MIPIKNKASIAKMEQAGTLLSQVFKEISPLVRSGITTAEIDTTIERLLQEKDLVSRMKGYRGYQHVSCISVNDQVVHGVPGKRELKDKDIVKIDICASWRGYCADMARIFFVGSISKDVEQFVAVAQKALDAGIAQAQPGNRLTDISAAIQQEIDRHGYGIIREFAGHGIGKRMHEEPELLNYGEPKQGPMLRAGMALAIEPMITMGKHDIVIEEDGWTVSTQDRSLAAHVEDTVIITEQGPNIITRAQK